MINYFVIISKVFLKIKLDISWSIFVNITIIMNNYYFTALNITVNIAIWAELLIWKI